MATRIVRDAKAQYPAVCNAAETLLVHRAVAARFLPPAAAELRGAGVELRGDPAACALIDARPCTAADWDAEYLDLVLAIKVVEDLDEAIRFINRHGSHHTDTIVTADPAAAHAFLARVDSATVLWNASTRFADGFRFGMGAEVGISTNRIHARGPVGLDGLVTYKYRVLGSGQIVADYVNGTRAFHFAELADGVAVPGAAPVAAS
jgi:glutamate-5-semialdehyde dehydrogenase